MIIASAVGRRMGMRSWRGGDRPDAIERATAITAAALIVATVLPALMSGPDETGAAGRRALPLAAGSGSGTAVPAETIVAGYGGITHTHASDVHFTRPADTDLKAHDVQWIGRPFKSPIYYGIRVLHWPGAGQIGGMLDFTHAKAIAERSQQVRFSGARNGQPDNATRTVEKTFRHLEFSHGHNMLTLNGLLRLAPPLAVLRPYVGAGAGISLPHSEVQFHGDDGRTYAYQYAGPVGQVLAGVELRLPAASLFVEYKLSLAPYEIPLSGHDGTRNNFFLDWWRQLTGWWNGEAPRFGRLSTRLVSHHLIGGIGYRHAVPREAAGRR